MLRALEVQRVKKQPIFYGAIKASHQVNIVLTQKSLHALTSSIETLPNPIMPPKPRFLPLTLPLPLRLFFRHLSLPRYTPATWHLSRINEELSELNSARTRTARLSERADVLFAITRAHHDGYPRLAPIPPFVTGDVWVYMFLKYGLRAGFYRVLGRWTAREGDGRIREVVNPERDEKLEVVARRHGRPVGVFVDRGRRLRRWWPLLP